MANEFLKSVIGGAVATGLAVAAFLGAHKLDSSLAYDPRLDSPIKLEQKINDYSLDASSKSNSQFAIIVSPEPKHFSKAMGCTKEVQCTYDALKSRGLPDKNIIILSDVIPEGRDVGDSMNAKATKQNLSKAIKFVAGNSGEKSSTLFYFAGHGSQEKKDSTLVLSDKEMNQKEFAKDFKGVKGDKVFLFNQCFSGGFVDQLKDINGDVAMFAATTGDSNASRSAPIGIDFWKNVDKGMDLKSAYVNAVNKNKGRTIDYVAKILDPLTKGGNEAVFYVKGDAHLPKGKSSLERKVDTNDRRSYLHVTPSSNIVSKAVLGGSVMKTIFFALIVYIALFFFMGTFTLNGAVIGYNGNVSFGFFLFFFFILLIIYMFRKKQQN